MPEADSKVHSESEDEEAGDEATKPCVWMSTCKVLYDSVKQEEFQCLFEKSLWQKVLDAKDNEQERCIVLDTENSQVEYVTDALKEQISEEKLSRSGSSLAALFRIDQTYLNDVVNYPRWSILDNRKKIAQSDQTRMPIFAELVLGQSEDGKLYWSLACAFHKLLPVHGNRLIVLETVLQTEVSDTLLKFTRQLELAANFDVLPSMIKKVNDDVQEVVTGGQAKSFELVSQDIDQCCKSFEERLLNSFEGDHIVPNVGAQAVEAFEQLAAWESIVGDIEKDLKTAWEATDEIFKHTRTSGAKSIACAVSDPESTDCPLVYISPGFEQLTKYNRVFALGRNCRFLQPKKREQNFDYNGDELIRMKKFCTEQKAGQIINFLVNESSDGHFFWNLLFMNYMRVKGHNAGTKKSYIFGVQTNMVVHHHLLQTLIFDDWERRGKRNLAKLRDMIQQEELTFSVKSLSLISFSDSIIRQWAWEVGKAYDTCWEGQHYVPVVGRPAVLEFGDEWPSLVEEAAEGIKALFKLTEENAMDMKKLDSEALVCSVADPAFFDCPLVFLSKGFEIMTGYDREFGLGRNCRFLQPNTADLNKKINGDELRLMKEFSQQPHPLGTKIVNLLLNERKNGERFWNLLHMQHVQVRGKPYILGVQTDLDLPMPSLIRAAEVSNSVWAFDPSMLTSFVDEMCIFLDQMRLMFRSEGVLDMLQAAEHASKSIMNFMKRTCDDYEGDHMVPRIGQSEVKHFELDVTWKAVLFKVKTLLVQIWDVSEFNEEEVACAVSDPQGDDCPLVYVSRKFETMTGYPRDWVLGRNCRFLQPNDCNRNHLFNEEDKLRMRDFCSKPQPEGTRIINLLINEEKSGYPFWNLLVMEHIDVGDRTLIFGVQTKIDIEPVRMAEILTADRDGISELSRLRVLLRKEETSLQTIGMKRISNDIVRQWASDFPLYLEIPRFHLVRSSCLDGNMPLIALTICPQQSLIELLRVSLEEGVRHFALMLNSDESLECKSYVEQMSRLLSFKLAEVLNLMRLNYLHYMRNGTKFTIVTRPQYLQSFKSISKALAASGYFISCWLLDVRAVNCDKPLSKAGQEKIVECWQTMIAARKSGEAKSIGLYGAMGSIMHVMHCVKDVFGESQLSALSVLALDDYPNKEADPHKREKFRKAYLEEYGSPSLLTYNLYGPNNCLLKNKALKDCAQALKVDVCTMLLKWAEVQGYGAMVNTVRDTGFEIMEQQDHKALPNFHRDFTRNYGAAPDASICATEVDSLFEATAMQAEYDKVLSKRRTFNGDTIGSQASTTDESPKGTLRRASTARTGQLRRSSTSAVQDATLRELAGRRRNSSGSIAMAISRQIVYMPGGEEPPRHESRTNSKNVVPELPSISYVGTRRHSTGNASEQKRRHSTWNPEKGAVKPINSPINSPSKDGGRNVRRFSTEKNIGGIYTEDELDNADTPPRDSYERDRLAVENQLPSNSDAASSSPGPQLQMQCEDQRVPLTERALRRHSKEKPHTPQEKSQEEGLIASSKETDIAASPKSRRKSADRKSTDMSLMPILEGEKHTGTGNSRSMSPRPPPDAPEGRRRSFRRLSTHSGDSISDRLRKNETPQSADNADCATPATAMLENTGEVLEKSPANASAETPAETPAELIKQVKHLQRALAQLPDTAVFDVPRQHLAREIEGAQRKLFDMPGTSTDQLEATSQPCRTPSNPVSNLDEEQKAVPRSASELECQRDEEQTAVPRSPSKPERRRRSSGSKSLESPKDKMSMSSEMGGSSMAGG